MTDLPYPAIEHVEVRELVDLQAKNQIMLRAQYEGDASDFRATVLHELLGKNAIYGGAGWAIYRDHSSTTDSNVLSESDDTTTLVFTTRRYSPTPQSLPFIRMVSQVAYHNEDDLTFLTHDFTLDQDNDAQLAVGVAMLTMEAEKESAWLWPTDMPFFYLNSDGVLVFRDAVTFTPILRVSEDPESLGHGVTPFGHYENIEDRIAALSTGREMLGKALEGDLVAQHRPPSQT